MTRVSQRLPDFPWDTLAEARVAANAHPGGVVDLSVGTPVDPTPGIAREALAAASDAHGYPTTWGTPALRASIVDYLARRWGVADLSDRGVLPVIGTKEAVAWLPTQLGLGPDDLVVIPETAYPTYDVGARLAGCRVQRCDDPAAVAGQPALIWINSPANPHGAVADEALLARWVAVARANDAVLASDECYGEFGWEAEPVSALHPDLCGGEHTNLLVLHSTSKRSNLAGYRAGFIAGDVALIAELLGVRKHSGMMLPTPVQAAMAAVLADQRHVLEQRERYRRRRAQLAAALLAAGFRIDDSQGSLYLWVTRDEPCRATVAWFAARGVLVAPGDFYGVRGARHVRVALTATDERIAAAVQRLA